MQCSLCNMQQDLCISTITDAAGIAHYCLNCLVGLAIDNKLNFENDPMLIDDVTGESGAVKYENGDEIYILEKERMRRLIAHSLYPDEYFALAKKYGADKFELHSDFYDAFDGEAVQPFILT